MEILVFKTTICTKEEARLVSDWLQRHFPQYTINFDLSDCDKIMRVSCPKPINSDMLIKLMSSFGFQIEELNDSIPPIKSKFLQPLDSLALEAMPLGWSEN